MVSPAEHNEIRVRMAPSPTGPLHIGTARTTLINWLFARHVGGTFVLRIEDTDKERSKKEYEDGLIDGLQWLGIEWDEGPILATSDKGQVTSSEKGDYGPYRQSERTEIYKKYLKQLFDKGAAYYCYCTKEELEAQKDVMTAQGLPPKYSGHCRNLTAPPAGKNAEVIRFKIPEVTVEFHDMIRGKVSFDAGLFGDMVIAKDLDTPLYNFAVVVDDELMHISHVVRGEDHISNTPKQILVARALGFKEPVFAHLPLILSPDRSKMSKRYGDTTLAEYRAKGYLPDALVNFLALLGWHPKGDEEVLSRQELVGLFDITRVQKAGAIFSEEKLDWLNREYLKKMGDDEIAKCLAPLLAEEKLKIDEPTLVKIVALGRGRASTLRDFIEEGKGVLILPNYEPSLLIWKNATKENVAPILEELSQTLSAIAPGQFTREHLAAAIAAVVEDKSNSGGELPQLNPRNRGEVFWPLRVAVTGREKSPDPIDVMNILGKEDSLKRIEVAIKKLES
jgi:glutamyl-tRNA synthetase